ncbi:MAG TPA: cytochrome c3 family protein [Geobacteraceae bacterium]|nr:cytochrome c3 family protein [Geobacteraceae bacterium]
MYKITITFCGLMLTIMAGITPRAWGESLPDRISIETLQNLYSPVSFEHARHIERERDCAVCHHHTNGAPAANERCISCHRGGHEVKSMSCTSCHEKEPFSTGVVNQKFKNSRQFHQDKPGLMASYHLGCIGCHKKKGGPESCTGCHGLTSKGEAFYKTGKHAPDPGKSAKRSH